MSLTSWYRLMVFRPCRLISASTINPSTDCQKPITSATRSTQQNVDFNRQRHKAGADVPRGAVVHLDGLGVIRECRRVFSDGDVGYRGTNDLTTNDCELGWYNSRPEQVLRSPPGLWLRRVLDLVGIVCAACEARGF
jgi:hypothetical protein